MIAYSVRGICSINCEKASSENLLVAPDALVVFVALFLYNTVMSQTQTYPANPSLPGTAQWIYDEIMRFIEPDLLTTRIGFLDEIYANETEDEGKKRMMAYEKAFAIFDKVAEKFESKFNAAVLSLRKGAREQAISEERVEEDKSVLEIESKFQQTDSSGQKSDTDN